MLEHGGVYTSIKLDQSTNLGAVRVRIRSLLAALDLRRSGRRLSVDAPPPTPNGAAPGLAPPPPPTVPIAALRPNPHRRVCPAATKDHAAPLLKPFPLHNLVDVTVTKRADQCPRPPYVVYIHNYSVEHAGFFARGFSAGLPAAASCADLLLTNLM